MKNTIISVIFIFILLSQGCSHRDQELEKVFVSGIARFKASNEQQLDLVPLIGGKWKKVCIQTPYMLKKNFEKSVEMDIDAYKTIEDGVNRIWIFYDDESIRWVDIPRVSVMDFKQDSKEYCTARENPFLYAGEFFGSKAYFFYEN